MRTLAVVFDRPQALTVRELSLTPPGDADVVVDIEWTGISVGTERLLWTGRMPEFPGMGYPLVPGYESVGRVAVAGTGSGRTVGDRVFVPGARCFGDTRGLFGGAAARLVVAGARTFPISEELEERGVLLALAATAYHALRMGSGDRPQLIIGHGALGRLMARLQCIPERAVPGMAAAGGTAQAPVTVWETNPARRGGAHGYRVCDPGDDLATRYHTIYEVSGDARGLDALIARLTPGGDIVLAGFYTEPLSFHFPAAFMREASLRVAAEWQPADMTAVVALANAGLLDLSDLITHHAAAERAADAYATAFTDSSCVKMVLDWRHCA